MKTIYSTKLTGTKMSQLGKVGQYIKPGTELGIFNRPDNAYDNQAMSVHFGASITDPQVGWIPNKEFEDKIVKNILNNLVRHGIALYAVVTQYNPETKDLSVNINLVEDPFHDGLEDDYDEDEIPGTGDEEPED